MSFQDSNNESVPQNNWSRGNLVRAEPAKRSEEHTSEPSHLVISYAVFCLKKKKDAAIIESEHATCSEQRETTCPAGRGTFSRFRASLLSWRQYSTACPLQLTCV